MFSLLSCLFGFRRTIGLGVAVAALIVSLSHFMPLESQNSAKWGALNKQLTQTQVNAPSEPVAMPQTSDSMEATEDTPDGEESNVSREKIFKALEMDENGFNWRKDWWKYLCIVIVGLLVVVCGIRLTKMLFRLVIFAVCVVTGILGAFWFGPMLTPVISPHIPESIQRYASPELVGYAAGFALAYLIVTIVIAILPKTVRGGGTTEK